MTAPRANLTGLLAPLVLSLAVAGGCGSEAIAPTPTRLDVSISPSTAVLKVGETEQFSVVEALSNGTRRTLSASWASDHPSVISVNGSGNAIAVSAGSATVSAVIDDARLTRAMQAVPDVSGRWSGQLRFTSCVHESGSGSGCPTGLAGPLILTLTQVHDQVSGIIVQGFINEFSGPLTGSMSADGAMTASATITGDGEVDTISDWQSRLGDSTLEGRFTMRRRFTNIFGPQVLLVECELVGVKKQ